MKYLIAVVMVFVVAACNERQETGKAPTSSPSAQTSTDSAQSPGIATGPAQTMPQAPTSGPAAPGIGQSSGSSGSSEENYTVAAGDTLSSIARSHGIRYQDIANWNGIKDPNRIREGQTLRMSAP